MNCKFSQRASAEPQVLESGYTLAGVLVLIAIMSIFMAMSVPIWDRIKQRENEEELLFRGKEYIEAIALYHKKFNSYPPDIKTLYEQRFLRKLYKDPMTKSGEWKVLHPDSLVETGAAGAIDQPGTKGSQDKDTKKDDKKSKTKKNQKPKNNLPGLGDTDDKSQDESEDDSEEEGGAPGLTGDQKEQSIGAVVGVCSRSKKTSLQIYNGQSTYNKWIFAFVPQQQPEQQQPPPTSKPGGGKNPKPPKPGTNQNEDDHN